LTLDQKRTYWQKRDAGYSMRASSVAAGIGLTSARALERGMPPDQRRTVATAALTEMPVPEPRRYEELSAEAKHAWNDFGYFQRRYFGRIPISWQTEAADEVRTYLESPEEEYCVINAPPGTGKTLLFTHDIPAWLTTRNRAIRGQMGAATGSLAERYTRALRTTFERTIPVPADLEYLRAGTAFDAEATLAQDFGRFKPLSRELWQANAFVVAQYGDVGAVSGK
jgi:hypothetical protein